MVRFLLAPAVFDFVGIGVISGAFGFAAGARSPCPSHDPILVSIDRCWNATPVPGLPPREIQGRYRAFAVSALRSFSDILHSGSRLALSPATAEGPPILMAVRTPRRVCRPAGSPQETHPPYDIPPTTYGWWRSRHAGRRYGIFRLPVAKIVLHGIDIRPAPIATIEQGLGALRASPGSGVRSPESGKRGPGFRDWGRQE